MPTKAKKRTVSLTHAITDFDLELMKIDESVICVSTVLESGLVKLAVTKNMYVLES